MFLVMHSANAKIGDLAATYLPIEATCPTTCPHKGNGCYAQGGNVGFHVHRLEKATKGLKSYDLIRKEAREIIKAGKDANGRSLRLHVSGDVRTNATARLLGNAAIRWIGKVYTYTHSWRQVTRSSWGPISVLASCETLQQASQAWEKGYAAAVIVPEHKSDKAYTVGDMKVIPCPQQTREVTCEKCGLCMSDAMLHKQKAVIAFAAHGYGKKRVRLTVLQS